MKRVAVIGAGISGLAAARALSRHASVVLFEADQQFGGHARTVDVTLDGITHGVDTGFLVFNERTYPRLLRLFAELGVETAASEMSFSVQVHGAGLEWNGTSLNGVFAQRLNLLRPAFMAMLIDVLRFNRLATQQAQRQDDAAQSESIADFLDRHRLGTAFRDWYLLPMIGCIWSCPTDQMLRFPIATLVRFCHNHGLLQISNRPQWRTVRGGSRHYVQRMLADIAAARPGEAVRTVRRLPSTTGVAGVQVLTDRGEERFDDVVLACHSDQALQLLADADGLERSVLGRIRYQPNEAVLHTDESVLPRQRRAWASWNYQRSASLDRERAVVCLHYLINRLQPLPWQQPVIVSLNPDPRREPDAARVISRHAYSHPVFDAAAVAAQRELPDIQGRSHVWFCGAWTRYGFHEDGLMSAETVAAAMQECWKRQEQTRAAA